MAQANKGLRLGTTLFSLTNEFHSLDYTFEELIAKVGALGLGPGLEVIGFQSIRGFPEVSDGFADRFKALLAKHNLVPTCLAINADVAIRRGQKMSAEESVRYHEPQIRAAAKLGFPVARYQYAAGPEVIERLVPLAEKLGVILGLEVHAPHKVDSPTLLAFREMYARVRSPFLGFIPDFGSSARTVPPGLLNVLRSRGVSDDLIEVALAIWREESGTPAGEDPEADGNPGGARDRTQPRERGGGDLQHPELPGSKSLAADHAAMRAHPRQVLRVRRER